MRLKLITLIYTLSLCLLLGVGIHLYQKSATPSTNITQIHKSAVELQKEFRPKEADRLSDKYHCQILFYDDRDYSSKFWSSINRNDILIDLMDENGATVAKAIFDRETEAFSKAKENLWRIILVMGICLALLGYLLIFSLYRSLVRPFHQLQSFASAVSKGNLDFPLPMRKDNFFGAFTSSFDLLREELKLAKQKEYEANQSKKELVAELSHDIKTPVATIRANCELLLALSPDSMTKAKLQVIDSKAGTIEKLVDNLFHATLDELQVLKVEPKETSSLVIEEMVADLHVYGDIRVLNSIPRYLVWLDELRFSQVLDNILYNSYKYAQTPVEIAFENQDSGILIRISDSGPGILEEDLPLVTNKFYRGKNAGNKTGSGLGLFLAKTFMEQMKGELFYYNKDGFVVELFVKRV